MAQDLGPAEDKLRHCHKAAEKHLHTLWNTQEVKD